MAEVARALSINRPDAGKHVEYRFSHFASSQPMQFMKSCEKRAVPGLRRQVDAEARDRRR